MARPNFLLMVFFILAGCSAPRDGYQISGDIKGLDADKIYLQAWKDGEFVYLDSAEINEETFTLNGKTAYPQRVTLFFKNKNGRDEPLCSSFYLENSKIKIEGNIKDRGKIDIKGSHENHIFSQLNSETAYPPRFFYLKNLLYKSQLSGKSLPKDSLQQWNQELESLNLAHKIQVKRSVRKYAGTAAALDVLMENLDDSNLDEIRELLRLSGSQKSSPAYQGLEKIVKLNGGIRVGQKLATHRLPDSLGNYFPIWSGGKKWTVIDFWASWCGPCRKQIPLLKNIYQNHQGAGFEIVSISIDRDRQAWLNALREERMPWVTLIAPDENWATNQFLITAIPYMVLLDHEGKVVKKNLSMDELLSVLD